MITLTCLHCHLALRTTGELQELDYLIGPRSEWFPNRYPCPRSGCNSQMIFSEALDSKILAALEIHDLSPQEVFQALNGMGLPNEKKCDLATVLEALNGQKIVGIDASEIRNAGRTVVRSITLEDGKRIYFGSAPQGAIIYRVAPSRSLAKEMLGGD